MVVKLISFQKLGENRESPRLWLESQRLETLGFGAGTPFSVERRLNGVCLRPVKSSNNHVSKRISVQRVRPIIDIANRHLLSPLDDFPEIKVTAAFKRIDIVPSVRGFHIHRKLKTLPPFKTLEVFCDGGTLSAAVTDGRHFQLIAGVEVVAVCNRSMESGRRVYEVPVDWIEDLDSRVRIVSTATEDIKGLLRVRARRLRQRRILAASGD